MGKFSYKKRKGTRKQSFKNRKRVKRGGDDGDAGNGNAAVTSQEEVNGNTAAAAATVTTTAAADAASVSTAADAAAQKEVNGNTGTDNPNATATDTGQYTADDAGYQKFMQDVKSNSELLKSVVYVNDQMSQIFLKQGTSWKEIAK